ASDYMVSPFTFTELIARIGVWLRQTGRTRLHGTAFDAAGTERLRIDRTRRLLFVEGREVHITPLECKVLVALTGRPLTEEQLMSAVWGTNATRVSHYLHAQLRNLRRKVERDPSNPRYLVTEPSGRLRLRFAPS
ncbi:MAG TPA: winged helix-turn-helix domain-containing protein, partial [Polyangiaceae bacterium]|nr:winged helix-turn-helix domain-containing protein [Polyangiaceae bacterium]